MVRCLYCAATSHDKQKRSFHSFPVSDDSSFALWKVFVTNKFPNATISKTSKLCSDHFLAQDLVVHKDRVKLKPDAVPTKKHDLEELSDELLEGGAVCRKDDSSPFVIKRPRVVQGTDNNKATNTVGHFSKPNIFNADYMLQNPKQLNYYTGFKHPKIFLGLLEFFVPGKTKLPNIRPMSQERKPNPETPRRKKGRKAVLKNADQFLLVMMRLRQNFGVWHLGNMFQIHESTVSRIFNAWIIIISKMMQLTPIWPSREIISRSLPAKFNKFPNTRVILDCTEFQIQKASSSIVQAETYSYYKSRNTAKGLVGITPLGQVSFVSNLYGGKNSDKKIVAHSAVLDLLEPGDAVMVDRGFRILDECNKRGIELIIPDFTEGTKQFQEASVQKTRSIAMARGLVETVIGRTKNFKILSSSVPLAIAPVLNHIWIACNYLSNFTSSPDAPLDENESEISTTQVPNIACYPPGPNRCKKVVVPFNLVQRFMELAQNNTNKNIETVGWLFAIEDSSKFSVRLLLLPQQEGTASSVTTSGEEDVLEAVPENDVQIGWIHTHPTQTCFMSSQDLHTHFGLQNDRPESIAIVCAPSYNRYDAFRLEVPYGMNVIQNCGIPIGLHVHENISKPLYSIADNVELDSNLTFEIQDLRSN